MLYLIIKLRQISVAILTWGAIIFTVEMVTEKLNKTRKLLVGEPNIVIREGNIKYDALKKAKLDMNSLQSLIRQEGYFSLQEVEYVIMESNGKISVLPKSEYDTPKTSDFNMPSKPVYLPIALILDGEVVKSNLTEVGFDEHWLRAQLAMQNITSFKEVLYAEWSTDKALYVVKHEKKSS